MMLKKYLYNVLAVSFTALISFSAEAQYNPITSSNSSDSGDDDIRKVATYIKNFGYYIGFPVDKTPQEDPYAQLINPDLAQVMQIYSVNTLLGSIPVNAVSDAYSMFVSENSQQAKSLNTSSNMVYSQDGSNQGDKPLYISALVDQKTFLDDPVSQSVLNVLGTPDASYCIANDGKNLVPSCKFLTNFKISTNTVGKIPTPEDFFSYDYISNFVAQLNANTLTAPLWYNSDGGNKDDTSSDSQSSGFPGVPGMPGGSILPSGPGLTASDQLTAAQRFIEYASSGVTPLPLADKTTYANLYNTAMTPSKSTTEVEQQDAVNQLTNYLAGLRVYASQVSIVTGNLYSIFNKRLPQKLGTTQGAPETSQALSEYNMATWRLYNPNQQQDQNKQQWIEKINTASPATVQKEMAILLAEINYQMYLNRQEQERLLLTNSIMLLQYLKMNSPSLSSSGGE